jgi:hypothetical protein
MAAPGYLDRSISIISREKQEVHGMAIAILLINQAAAGLGTGSVIRLGLAPTPFKVAIGQ